MKYEIFFPILLVISVNSQELNPCPANTTFTRESGKIKTCDNTEINTTAPGCYSNDGYVLDRNTGQTILPQDCPADQNRCGSNQVWAQCKNTCHISCDNYRNPPRACTLQCEEGCNCLPEHVWYGDSCVPTAQCDKVIEFCSVNKTYRSTNIKIKTCDKLEFHTTTPGCYCRDGYVLDRNTGNCVLLKDCPADQKRCGLNQVWARCQDTCRVSCDNYKNPPKICSFICREGCNCLPGHVLYGNGCVSKAQCERLIRPCSGNKTFRSVDISILTCDHIHINPRRPGCYCKNDYVYNRFTGHCCLPKDCPKDIKCAKKEIKDTCATPCPKTCRDINPPTCYPIRCETSCTCLWPYVRNEATGICILPTQCPEPVCHGDNEELKICGTSSQSICFEQNLPNKEKCHTDCFCKSGYTREYQGGKCIPTETCGATHWIPV